MKNFVTFLTVFALTGNILFSQSDKFKFDELNSDAFYRAKNLQIWMEILDQFSIRKVGDIENNNLLKSLNQKEIFAKILSVNGSSNSNYVPSKLEFEVLNREYFRWTQNGDNYEKFEKEIDKQIKDIEVNNQKLFGVLKDNKYDYIFISQLDGENKTFNIKEFVYLQRYDSLTDGLVKDEFNIAINDESYKICQDESCKQKSIEAIERKFLVKELAKYKLIVETLSFTKQDINLRQKQLKENGSTQQLLEYNTGKNSFSTSKMSLIASARAQNYNFEQNITQLEIPQNKIPSQSDMIDALSILIANRFKEETALTFVDKLRTVIATDSILSIILPQTTKIFQSVALYVNPSFGSSWKEALANDFANIIPNLKNYYTAVYDCNACDNGGSHQHIVCDLITITDILGDLKNGVSFFDVIDYQSRNILKCDDSTPSNFKKVILVAQLFNQNLRTYQSNNYFANYHDVLDLIQNDSISYNFFVQEINNGLELIFPEITVQFDFKNLQKIIFKYQRLEQILRELHKPSGENGIATLYQYWGAIEEIFEATFIFMPDNSETKVQIQKTIGMVNNVIEIQRNLESRNYGSMINHLSLLLKTLLEKQDYLPLTDFDIILAKRSFRGDKRNKLMIEKNRLENLLVDLRKIQNCSYEEFKTKYNLANMQDRSKLITDILVLNKLDIDKHKEIKDSLDLIFSTMNNNFTVNWRLKEYWVYYVFTRFCIQQGDDLNYTKSIQKTIFDKTFNTLDFFVDVLTVQDSKELSKLITSKAAPVSSYKIKRNNRFSIDINAYPMLYSGVEWQKEQLFFKHYESPASVNGFSCPVGISFSRGNRYFKPPGAMLSKNNAFMKRNGKYKALKGNSQTLTFTFIDLGAPVSYRISQGEDGELPQQVRFDQFFAPGLFYSFGIKRTPLAIIVGGQFTPKLRSFSESEQEFGAFRLSAGLVMDIPLYNVFHITKRQGKFYSSL